MILVFLSLKYCYFQECFIDNGKRIEDKFKNSDKSQISRQGEALRRDEEEGRAHLSTLSIQCGNASEQNIQEMVTAINL